MFVQPPKPRDSPPYPQFATPQVIKTCERLWENARNYCLLYINLSRVCFRMLDKLVPDQYKVSNNPNLLGWNPTMSI